MKPFLLLLALLQFAVLPAAAQVRPSPGVGDTRIQKIVYNPDEVVLLEVAPGYQLTVELAGNEEIENVAVGDSASWQVTANKRGDRLFIKPLQQGAPTNLTVITTERVYAMELAPLYGPTPEMAYTVRYLDPPKVVPLEQADAAAVAGRYRVRGDRLLRPAQIRDDGVSTFIEWPEDRPLPAVFGEQQDGKEVLVNGNMRDGLFVLDGVFRKLLFRIDRRTASASRSVPRPGR